MNQEIVLAGKEDLEDVDALCTVCKEDLLNKHIYQWDDPCPNKEYFLYTIEAKERYILRL
jgi:hypothetical protein